MLTFKRFLVTIQEGKMTTAAIRNVMAIINRKPVQFLEEADAAFRAHKPRLKNNDFSLMVGVLKGALMGYKTSHIRKGVEQDHVEQLTLINKIYVDHIHTHGDGEFPIHVPVYTITYGDNQIGFSFYLSNNKPTII